MATSIPKPIKKKCFVQPKNCILRKHFKRTEVFVFQDKVSTKTNFDKMIMFLKSQICHRKYASTIKRTFNVVNCQVWETQGGRQMLHI